MTFNNIRKAVRQIIAIAILVFSPRICLAIVEYNTEPLAISYLIGAMVTFCALAFALADDVYNTTLL